MLTTGCRLNQSESDALRRKLSARGVAVLRDPAGADVCYVNTCTVTAAADRSSIQLIRRAARLSPRPRLIVLGCLAERSPDRVGAIAGVDEVWTNGRKQQEIGDACPAPARSRALLKVQDGCDRRCAYCVVSRLRGEPVAMPARVVLRQFERLLADGYHEVVLTGLNLGTYRDSEGTTLADLARMLLARPGEFRIRIGSIEPDTVNDDLVEVLAHDRVCAHLHMPLQSGDDRMLAAMGRRYTAADYARVVGQVCGQRPDTNIGADVIVGFPGEDDNSRASTASFLDSLPIGYLHVFSFSPRPGTAAAQTGSCVPPSAVRAQVRALRSLSDRRRAAYSGRFVGMVRGAIVESTRAALTDNYIKLAFGPGIRHAAGSLVSLRIGLERDRLVGRSV